MPVWADFMRRVARDLPAEPVAPPAGLHGVELCRMSSHRPRDGCPTYVEYFKTGDEVPLRPCPIHAGSFVPQTPRAVQGLLTALGERLKSIFR
jgi:membrane carboxypeptidase/penicillin-binding protein